MTTNDTATPTPFDPVRIGAWDLPNRLVMAPLTRNRALPDGDVPGPLAVDYLAKPADADEIHGTLMAQPGERADPPENPMSADRVRWEHIQRVYEQCDRNVSETARRLHMHRRTLQRILAKRGPR